MITNQLQSLVSQLDYLILQHVNYLNKLDECVRLQTVFEHKKHTECNFGKLFYSDIWPSVQNFPDDIKQVIKEIEDEHRIFHTTASEVNTLKPTQETVDATTACKLILKLYHLEELVKKYSL
ncbi:MAG: CZB domain-containing protein [Bacteroidota bacterium]